MALPTDWPVELPKGFEADSYGSAPQSGVIRTEMSSGYAKVRRRFTAVITEHSGTMIMTKEQFETYFVPFFKVTIDYGTIPFDFPNPLDGGDTEIEVRWLVEGGSPPYTWKQHGPGTVSINFALEELPS